MGNVQRILSLTLKVFLLIFKQRPCSSVRIEQRFPKPRVAGSSPARGTRVDARKTSGLCFMHPLLTINDLHTYFQSGGRLIRAVEGISLKVQYGETLGIVGESGCGKTVTALSIMRLIPSPPGKIIKGQIIYHPKGVDLAELASDDKRLREIRGKHIAMIFQDPMASLNPVYTIGSQITETIKAHQNLSRKEARERALEMLEKVQISMPQHRMSEYPHQLSGGMRQRVMIAIALACKPNLLIADEPTSALDVTTRAQILQLMKELQRELGMAIMLITHDLSVISEVADKVAVIYMGKVVEYADAQTILSDPRHPYTQGLLRSTPMLGNKERLTPIKGNLPDQDEEITGCKFSPRCPKVKEICKNKPPLEEVETGHLVRCWLHLC